MSKYYFAYGSNLNLNDMKHRCPNVKLVGKTMLPGYRLVFKGVSAKYSYLTIEKDDTSCVPVGIFEVEDTDILRLDMYEGYPELYSKQYIKISDESGEHQALIYVMNDQFDYNMPSHKYFKTCLKGYMNFGFDLSFLAGALRTTRKHVKENKRREREM